MLGPLNIALEDFDVSPQYGFLPDQLPLQRLSNPYYEEWEDMVDHLPTLLKKALLRREIDGMRILSTTNLTSQAEWQRAYLLLALMAHGYIWGGEMPSQVRYTPYL